MRTNPPKRHIGDSGVLLCLTLFTACGVTTPNPVDDDTTAHGDDDSVGPPVEDDACGHWEAWGMFGVTLTANGGSFSGILYDDPSALMLDELIREGDCLFFGFDPMPRCEPTCDPPQVCGRGDQCHDWPVGLDLGSLQLTGTDPPLTLEAEYGNAYYTASNDLGPVDVGDEVTMTLAGGSGIEPFALLARGVALWDGPPGPLVMVQGQDLTVSWQPASHPNGAEVALYIGADHHAGVSAYVTCVVDDSRGTLDVPASIVDALIEAGTGGLGTYVENARVLRLDASSTSTSGGCALFYVATETLLDIQVQTAEPG